MNGPWPEFPSDFPERELGPYPAQDLTIAMLETACLWANGDARPVSGDATTIRKENQ